VPVRIAFEKDDIPIGWIISDYIMDGLFIIDIIINFNTALESDSGDLITSRKVISVEYFKTWFLIDFVSSIPVTFLYEVLGINSNTRFLKFAKIPRIFRILRVLKMIKLFKRTKKMEKWIDSI
jgi:hypothetical protein